MTLTIWELKDYEIKEWSLVHKEYLKIIKILKCFFALLQTFHPTDGNIVYFNFSNFITFYSMGIREMELIGVIPYNYDFYSGNAFPIVLLLWLIPILTLS